MFLQKRVQTLQKRFFLYAENWPAGDDIPATGLDRALVPIIQALLPLQPTILLKPFLKQCLRYPLHPSISARAKRPGLTSLFCDGLLRSFDQDYRGSSFGGRSLVVALEGAGGCLFSVLGGDGRAYLRADYLARARGLHHIIYTVDDPVAWAYERRSEKPRLENLSPQVDNVLRKAKSVLAITNNLASTLSSRLSRDIQPLSLPFVQTASIMGERKLQVIFVGNLSHLYADAFATVVRIIGLLRARGLNLTLRVTSTKENVSTYIPSVPEFIICGRLNNREELGQAIAESAAAICPISFIEEQDMVRTSFPSKLLDYLAYSRSIIVFGPKESAAARYFEENNLSFRATEEDELISIIELIIQSDCDLGFQYRACLEKNHGFERFREIVSLSLPPVIAGDGT